MSHDRKQSAGGQGSRREFLRDAWCGLGGLALASLLGSEVARGDAAHPLGSRRRISRAKPRA